MGRITLKSPTIRERKKLCLKRTSHADTRVVMKKEGVPRKIHLILLMMKHYLILQRNGRKRKEIGAPRHMKGKKDQKVCLIVFFPIREIQYLPKLPSLLSTLILLLKLELKSLQPH